MIKYFKNEPDMYAFISRINEDGVYRVVDYGHYQDTVTFYVIYSYNDKEIY